MTLRDGVRAAYAVLIIGLLSFMLGWAVQYGTGWLAGIALAIAMLVLVADR